MTGVWSGCTRPPFYTLVQWSTQDDGSLDVKLPTIWTDGKAEVGRVRKEKSRREKIREEKEKEDAGVRKGRKVAKHCVFPML